jgi:hypothetical protein
VYFIKRRGIKRGPACKVSGGISNIRFHFVKQCGARCHGSAFL